MNRMSAQTSTRTSKILVVDDQPLNVRALNEVFREDHYKVLMATSGEKAIEQARLQKPDLILLDVVMPGMDGHEVCRRLKEDSETADIPIIFVTGQADDAEEVFGFELGAADFITKPINPVIVRARAKTQVALKRQTDLLRNIAMMDGLTSVANRRQFDDSLTEKWRLCLRENRPLTVLMTDVDFFKKYNDFYGHLRGDDCLRQVALAMQQTLRRPMDLFCRYGGEEFAALLPFTDGKGGCLLAQAMIEKVEALNIEHQESPVSDRVTVSIGVASTLPTESQNVADLVDWADKALYQSKQAGRDRYTLYTCFSDG